MDSIGKPGIPGLGGVVVVLVLVVVAVLVTLLVTVDVTVVVAVEVSVEVVVSNMTSGPYFRIKPWSLTIHPSSGPSIKIDLRGTDIVGGSGCVETTSHVKPSQ